MMTSYAPSLAQATQDLASQGFSAYSGAMSIGWVDPSRLTRECMTGAVSKAQPLFLIVQFESVEECLRHSGRPLDLIVYHSHESDRVSLDDVVALRETFAQVQLVVLSDAESVDQEMIRSVLTSGASGFILTGTASLQMVVSAMNLVSSGGTFVPRDFLIGEVQASPVPPLRGAEPGRLTRREIAVLALVKQGKANKIIAYELGMSASTVKVHVRHIMRKMGATNRTQAAFNAGKILEAGQDADAE